MSIGGELEEEAFLQFGVEARHEVDLLHFREAFAGLWFFEVLGVDVVPVWCEVSSSGWDHQ